jgi:hypothetical protein
MKYKVGDKVTLDRKRVYPTESILFLEDNDYTFVIDVIYDGLYGFKEVNGKEVNGVWTAECVAGLYIEHDPITSRFEILDIR